MTAAVSRAARHVLGVPARPLRRELSSIAAVVAIAGYVAALGIVSRHTFYDIWGVLVVMPVLVAVSAPLLVRAMRREADQRIARLLPWAFAAHLAFALPRYFVPLALYHKEADADAYATAGTRMAVDWRHGIASWTPHKFPGTGWIDVVTGAVYSVTGATMLGGFMVFAAMSFWGCYLFQRAYQLAVPDGDHFRYAALVLLLPSMLFWPASIGKEGWMLLAIGTTAYGTARLVERRRGGWTLAFAGLAGTAAVRPHVTAMLFVAIAVAFLLRPAGPRASMLAPLAKGVGVVVLVIGGFVLVAHLTSFLQLDKLDAGSVQSTLTNVANTTELGASSFVAVPMSLHHPGSIPVATLNVLFRPLPYEAHNVQAMLAAAEAAFLLVLIVTSRRRIAALARQWRSAYLVFSALFLFSFVYAFSTFSNFGILTRERVQVLPFLMAVLCLRPRQVATATSKGHR